MRHDRVSRRAFPRQRIMRKASSSPTARHNATPTASMAATAVKSVGVSRVTGWRTRRNAPELSPAWRSKPRAAAPTREIRQARARRMARARGDSGGVGLDMVCLGRGGGFD